MTFMAVMISLTVRIKMTYTFITMGLLYLCTMLYSNTSTKDIAAK